MTEPGRAENSELYPWYDSVWLTRYTRALDVVRRVRPDALDRFTAAFDIFRTRPDFETTFLARPFDNATLGELRRLVKSLRPTDLELHEAKRMGRFIVHDHPVAMELARRSERLVSEVVGEAVEVAYTFLSLYTARGVCAVHMDAPESKWTLDLCIDQSVRWPIYFSQVVPWPDARTDWGKEWEEAIKRSPTHRFQEHTLEPGQAVVFSGSSQWHYRDPMPQGDATAFCTLLFLHYIPAGTRRLVHPKSWPELFGIPELAQVGGSDV